MARVAWGFDIVGICPHHGMSLDLALLILGDLAFPGPFLAFKVTLVFLCFRERKHDFTLPVTAVCFVCYSNLPDPAGSTPVHLCGCLGLFPGQLDLPQASMPSAERLQASVSPAAAKLLPGLCIPSHPVPPSPWQGKGRGADCQGNRWRRRRDSS